MDEKHYPDFYTNPNDRRSLYCGMAGSYWSDFVQGIITALQNRGSNEYPYIKLNPDNSVSIIVDNTLDDLKDDITTVQHFLAVMRDKKIEYKSSGYMVEDIKEGQIDIAGQLEYHRNKLGFPLVGNKSSVVEVESDSKTGLITYTLNLSPAHLDEILKMSSQYSYRGDNSLISLNKTANIKQGVIRLFPVLQMDNSYLIMAEGCQAIEMPAVQLFHIMPDLEGKDLEKNFHWVPKYIEKNIIDRGGIEQVIANILRENGFSEERVSAQAASEYILINPDDKKLPVRIVNMDENDRIFYSTYGNCGLDVLQNCASLEVDTGYFLQCIKSVLIEKAQYFDEKLKEAQNKEAELTGKLKDKIVVSEDEEASEAIIKYNQSVEEHNATFKQDFRFCKSDIDYNSTRLAKVTSAISVVSAILEPYEQKEPKGEMAIKNISTARGTGITASSQQIS